jgi:hypothetical protein
VGTGWVMLFIMAPVRNDLSLFMFKILAFFQLFIFYSKLDCIKKFDGYAESSNDA